MTFEIPSLHLKAIFLIHFVLSTWAIQATFFPFSYLYYNSIFLFVLLWGVHSRDSEEPIFMGLLINVVSILLDIMTIAIFYPDHAYGLKSFGIGMAILNLLLRPITCVILNRIRNERIGGYSNFGIPALGDYFGRRGPYENIDQPVSQSVPQTTVDTGSPQHMAFGNEKTAPQP